MWLNSAVDCPGQKAQLTLPQFCWLCWADRTDYKCQRWTWSHLDPQEEPLWCEVLTYLWLILWYLLKPVFFFVNTTSLSASAGNCLALFKNFLEKTLEFSALLMSSSFFLLFLFVCCLWVLFGGFWLVALFWFFSLIFCNRHKYNPAVQSWQIKLHTA